MNEWYEVAMFIGVFALFLLLARQSGTGCGSGRCGLSSEQPERTPFEQKAGPKDAQRSNRGES